MNRSFVTRFSLLSLLGLVALLSLSACQTTNLPDWLNNKPAKEPEVVNKPVPKQQVPQNAGLGPGFPTDIPSTLPEQTGSGEPMPSLTPYLTGERHREAVEGAAPPPPPVAPNRVRVAILLPLSGPYAGLGEAMLNAAQLALFDFSNTNFELVVHDTKGTPEGAAQAGFNAIGDGAAVILGPLLSASIKAVKPAAMAANVTMIGFSTDRSVAGDGTYTMGFLPGDEVARVTRYALSKGINRFAALAPDNEYGRTVTEVYQSVINREGAELVQVVYYDPNAEDFSYQVQQIADYDARRSALLAQKNQLKDKADELSKKAYERLDKLQTLGDLPYEALLVPDGGKRLQAVAALLPFYDVDPAKVRILGTGQWDVKGLGAEPALLGGWYAASDPAGRAGFLKEYQETYARPAPRLATLAYDATALAAVLGSRGDHLAYTAETLVQPGGFAGQDGIFRFLEDGTSERGLAIMQVGQKENRIIDSPPKAFPPVTPPVIN